MSNELLKKRIKSMQLKKYILFILILFQFSAIYPQAGKGVYRFLELPVSSRAGALGGYNISLRDNDVNFAMMNPALLTEETHGVLGLNMANYLTGIKFGTALYSHNIGENNLFMLGMQYIDYGIFEGYDEFGVYQQDFTAQDMALYISYARQLSDHFTMGATLKPIYSVYERYSSIGLAMDLGINYSNELFSAGLVMKNAGAQLKGYYKDEDGQHREPLPFDLQLGVSKKFEHAPLRISATAHNLHRWDVVGFDTNAGQKVNLDGTIEYKSVSFIDMAFRHLVFGVEFMPSNNFYIAAGYNHKRHKEMIMEDFKSMAGFSVGAGIKLYKFHVGFSAVQYQVKNNAYLFSISTNLNEFISF